MEKKVKAPMKAKRSPPPETMLMSAWREGGLERAIDHIQNNLLGEIRYSSRDYDYVRERKTFGTLFGTALRTKNPEVLVGFTPENVDYSRATTHFVGLFQCRHCHALGYYDPDDGTPPTDENERLVCKTCIPEFVYSDIQGCWISIASTVQVRTGASTYSVATERFATHSCPRVRDEYVAAEYAEELTNLTRGEPKRYRDGTSPFDPRVTGILSYHASKAFVERLPSPRYDPQTPPLLIGIELEIELAQQDKVESSLWLDKGAREVKAILNGPNGEEHYALTEQDGSITHGFEIVTGWTGLDTHERILSRMKEPAFLALVKKYGMKSHDTSTCGLHVTIDRAGMTPLHRGKFQVFLNAPVNKDWLDKICRRSASRYSKIKHDKFKKVSSGSAKVIRGEEGDRYEIANFHGNKHAIEFRGPRGTLRFETIMASMEFVRLVWMFTKQASMKELSASAFMDFMWRREHTAESQYLRAYMLERKIAPEEHIEMPTTRRYTVQESLVDASAMGFIASSKDL